MSISMFLKNRRKKHLLKKIAKLRLEAADLQVSIESSEKIINEENALIDLHKKKASEGDAASQIYLNCYLTKHLNVIKSAKKSYAFCSELYLLQKEEIARLEEELNSL